MSYETRKKDRKATEYHSCVKCHGTIDPGEKYLEITYHDDGWHTVRICANCDWRFEGK